MAVKASLALLLLALVGAEAAPDIDTLCSHLGYDVEAKANPRRLLEVSKEIHLDSPKPFSAAHSLVESAQRATEAPAEEAPPADPVDPLPSPATKITDVLKHAGAAGVPPIRPLESVPEAGAKKFALPTKVKVGISQYAPYAYKATIEDLKSIAAEARHNLEVVEKAIKAEEEKEATAGVTVDSDSGPEAVLLEIDAAMQAKAETRNPKALEPGDWTGFSLEMFRNVMEQLGLEVDYVVGSYSENIERMEKGELDTVATGVFLTKRSRERHPDWMYTHSLWFSGVSILTKVPSPPKVTDLMFSAELWASFGFLLLGLFVAGHVFWIFDKAETDEYSDEDGGVQVPGGYFKGNFVSTYWAGTTATTVGYGDVTPKTWGGKAWGLVGMFSSLFLVGMFTGAVTSALTVEVLANPPITKVHELDGLNVGVVKSSFPAMFVKEHTKAKAHAYSRMSLAIDDMLAGNLDAIVGVTDGLNYQSQRDKYRGKIALAGHPFQQHALVFPFSTQNSPLERAEKGSGVRLKDAVSEVLLDFQANNEEDLFVDRYFHPTPGAPPA